MEKKLGGVTEAGAPQTPVDKEKEAANERIMAVGRATGAIWAKPKEE